VRIFTFRDLDVYGTGSKLPSGTQTVEPSRSQHELQAGASHPCLVRIITVWNLDASNTGGKPPSGTQRL
jgi:hypothetical protein